MNIIGIKDLERKIATHIYEFEVLAYPFFALKDNNVVDSFFAFRVADTNDRNTLIISDVTAIFYINDRTTQDFAREPIPRMFYQGLEFPIIVTMDDDLILQDFDLDLMLDKYYFFYELIKPYILTMKSDLAPESISDICTFKSLFDTLIIGKQRDIYHDLYKDCYEWLLQFGN